MSSKYLVIDVECTGATNGTKANPFTPSNRLCCVGLARSPDDVQVLPIEYDEGNIYGHHIKAIQQEIDNADLVVTFTKFDLHWLRRYGVKFLHRPYYDIQAVEFILNGQRNINVGFDSVDGLLANYGMEPKLDVIKTEYWNKGIDTDKVPYEEVLVPYTKRDVNREFLLLLKQLERIRAQPELRRLIYTVCQDELVTQEMEWNGIQYDNGLSLRIADDLRSEVIKLDQKLFELFPFTFLNWGSPEQVSAALYGGEVSYEVSEPFLFHYKNPKKAPAEKLRKVTKIHHFDRLVEPPASAKLAKEGVFGTGESVLKKLKATGKGKEAISILLDRRGLEKKIGTWYQGFPEKIREFSWPDSILHSNLSHSTAGTGRLASTNPNVQNIEDGVRQCLTTRFPLSSNQQRTKVLQLSVSGG